MLLLWDLYWPVLVAALAIGVIAGAFAYRAGTPRKRSLLAIAAGMLATLAATALWHGPIGTADRFRSSVQQTARVTLDYYEMGLVRTAPGGSMLGRTLILSGPADDFQRRELVRILSDVPGIAKARWADSPGSSVEVPLIVEVELWSLVVFGLGLLLSYLIEVRRRARAEWRW